MLESPPAEDWLMWRRTPDSWAYSPLKQIDRDNVEQLTLAWALEMEPGKQESTPLVHRGVMYLVHAENIVQAVDASTGDLLWEYRRELAESVLDMFEVNMTRHLAIYEDKLFLATLDAHLVALDARTGAVVWDHEVADYTRGFSYTSGAMIFDGKVVSGIAGCTTTAPGGCFVTAHDPDTGRELWRVHSLPQPGDPAAATWGGRPIEKRWGGSMWMSGSYDPQNDLIFWGTGVPVPYGEIQRGGSVSDQSALYTNSTLAIDADTGERKWYRQHFPRDNWDMDHTFERFIVDREESGLERRTLVGIFGKLGIVWALDAATGNYLWSQETIFQNLVKDIDRDTGNVTINEDLIPEIDKKVDVCPSHIGGKNWNAGTYHPGTGAIYIAQNQTCMEYWLRTIDESKFLPGKGLHEMMSSDRIIHAPGKANAIGRIDAISATDGEILWTHEQAVPWTGALLSTGGGLLIGGDGGRRLKAFDVQNGDVLWEIPLSAAITGFPVTYKTGGRQYIAVPVGGGTYLDGALNSLSVDAHKSSGRNVLMVFALPESTVERK